MENMENNDTPENADHELDFTEQELEISLSSEGFVFHPDIEEDAELSQKLFRVEVVVESRRGSDRTVFRLMAVLPSWPWWSRHTMWRGARAG